MDIKQFTTINGLKKTFERNKPKKINKHYEY